MLWRQDLWSSETFTHFRHGGTGLGLCIVRNLVSLTLCVKFHVSSKVPLSLRKSQ